MGVRQRLPIGTFSAAPSVVPRRSPRVHPARGMMLLSHALFASVTCPDTKSLPLPSSPLTNTCAGGAAIFSPANLNGDADVLTIYNGDQM